MAIHVLPWHSANCHFMPWYSIDCHRIPWLVMKVRGSTWNFVACHSNPLPTWNNAYDNAKENLGIDTFSLNFRIAWKSTESEVTILQVLGLTWHSMVLYMAFHVKLREGQSWPTLTVASHSHKDTCTVVIVISFFDSNIHIKRNSDANNP